MLLHWQSIDGPRIYHRFGGTDNHSMLVDLRAKYPELTGKVAEKALVSADITVNKNMVPFDSRSAFFQTSGIRLELRLLRLVVPKRFNGWNSRNDWNCIVKRREWGCYCRSSCTRKQDNGEISSVCILRSSWWTSETSKCLFFIIKNWFYPPRYSHCAVVFYLGYKRGFQIYQVLVWTAKMNQTPRRGVCMNNQHFYSLADFIERLMSQEPYRILIGMGLFLLSSCCCTLNPPTRN